ncbi:LuxR family transcriptional regulator [Microbacterium invictum]|uniref:DNA-binding CsgD family transcriptional regulator n=1 Tax=Microbacterium invictum TaxID=515415 RepID=A0AA40SR47_9MICO|nr:MULTISPECIES: LuxR family transcriptional regulator [Microbacterium]MBB4140848.1 DNA-binding CsgD family transcriptional regulator [Microbacterium invictum]
MTGEAEAAPFADLLRAAADGHGATVDLDDAAQRDALVAEAATGADVIALGPVVPHTSVLARLLDELSAASLHVVSEAVDGVLRRHLVDALRTRSTARPTIVVVSADDASGSARVEFDRLRGETAELPVVWAIDHIGGDVVRAEAERPRSSEPAGPSSTPIEQTILEVAGLSPIALLPDEVAELTGVSRDDVIATQAASPRLAGVAHGAVLVTGDAAGSRATPPPATVRRAIAHDILAVLDRRGVAADLLAELALAASTPDDPLAVRVLADASQALHDADPDTAARYGLAAADLITGPRPQLTDLTWRLLPLLWQTSRSADARELIARVFSEDGRSDAEARALWWLARLEGSAEDAVRHTTHALTLPGVSEATQVKLLAVHLRLLSTLGRRDEVDALLPQAISRAARLGDDESRSRLVACDSIRRFYRGDYSASRALAEEAVASWRRSGAPTAEWMPEMIWAPHVELQLGDAATALQQLDDLLVDLEGRSQAAARRFVHAERSLVLLDLGRLDEAWDEAVLATTLAERFWALPPGASDRLQAIALSVRLKVALHRGAAAELHELREPLAADTPPQSEARARLEWWRFLLDEAESRVGASANPDALDPVSWLDPADDILIARALLRSGLTDALARIATWTAHRAAISRGHPLARTVADHVAGLTSRDAAQLTQVADDWARSKRPLLAAAARADAGILLIETGERSGLELVESAHDDFSRFGAHRDAWLLRRVLRGHGVAVGGASDAHPADGLTPTERRVLDRAVLGSTAPRIAEELSISPHTVTTHIRHIYAKLGLSSRADLMAWAGREGR